MQATGRHNNKNTTNFKDFFGKKKIREIIEQGIPPFLDYTLKDLFVFILVLLITIGVGLFIFNGVIDWRYKQELLMTPCQLCENIKMSNSYFLNLSELNITFVSPNSPASLGFDPT